MYKATKDKTLFDLGKLSKPTVEVLAASYNWRNNTATIQLIIREEGALFEHSRSFDIPAEGEVTSADVEAKVAEFLGTDFTRQ